MTRSNENWYKDNQQYLMTAVAAVREHLEHHGSSSVDKGSHIVSAGTEPSAAGKRLGQTARTTSAPAALETLTRLFGLSSFERGVLVMCAGMELDSGFAALCRSARGDPAGPWPTFSLALAALPDPHWSALTPRGPLRYWRLIEIIPGELLTTSQLRINERILHYLAGISLLDEQLAGLVELAFVDGDLVPSHRAIANLLVQVLSPRSEGSVLPVIQLCGNEVSGKRSIAAHACAALGLNLCMMHVRTLPNAPDELDRLARLWQREAVLSGCILFLDCDEMDPHDRAGLALCRTFCERTAATMIVSSRDRNLALQRAMMILDVDKPTASEQYDVWVNSLSERGTKLDGQLRSMASQFDLDTDAIQRVCSKVLADSAAADSHNGGSADDLAERLWETCRVHSRTRLDDLAHRINPTATWNDLVLPESQMRTLREIAIHVRQRSTVYQDWGFAAKSGRGLGITALFTGDSGTGKTMASEVLANELKLDLYRIDLSQTISKYIGETEKNLRRVFAAAQKSGAILLFDEADALFGKRSEVRDSHDRYANIEISYLLQCMEAYRGLAILTTNMKSSLDKAFFRRIRFVVHFPFPDRVHRARIWQGVFPGQTPTEGLDVNKLAKLGLPGGNIHNIALNAAFLAAEDGRSVRMEHLSQAARSEYSKLEKPLSSAEIGQLQ